MLYWPSADVTLNSCRAYFILKNLTGNNASSLLLNLDTSKDIPTGINIISPQSGRSQQMHIDDVTYDLQGRMILSSRLPQGIHIVNGKKTVNK
jgi:hypothetical protein